uniref:Uncharacterized protein n=1 Tax=Rhizophora mucronata TaxID=61149 RepID=A0A2P2PMT2_RHIMU
MLQMRNNIIETCTSITCSLLLISPVKTAQLQNSLPPHQMILIAPANNRGRRPPNFTW